MAVTMPEAKKDIRKFADADGQFRRPKSAFRDSISSEPGARFPPETDRYVGSSEGAGFFPFPHLL